MPTSEAELRELLDEIVWGQSVDPYAAAISAIDKSWYIYPWVLNQLHFWARQKNTEHKQSSRIIFDKCNIGEDGVRVMYNHYYTIADRYGKVAFALEAKGARPSSLQP